MIFSLFIFLIAPWAAFAGGSVIGNGGDVIVCNQNSDQPPYQMLDHYELKILDQKDLYLGSSSESPEQKVQHIINYLSKVSPNRAFRYQKALNEFSSRIQFVNQELVDIPDSFHVVLPAYCRIQQLAIQQQNPTGPTYIINRPLWDQLDSLTKAGLILHEIIYDEALEIGHKNSIKTREFHRFLLKFYTETNARDYHIHEALKRFGGIFEYKLKDGTMMDILPSLPQVQDGIYSGDISYRACGFKLTSGLQRQCSYSNPTRYKINTRGDYNNNYFALLSIQENEEMLWIASKEVFGTPFEVLYYNSEDLTLIPKSNVSIQTDTYRYVCKANQKIKFSIEAFKYIRETENNVRRLHFLPEEIIDCSLEKSDYAPAVLIANNWYPFDFIKNTDPSRFSLRGPCPGCTLDFKSLQQFNFGSFQFQASKATVNNRHGLNFHIQPTTVSFHEGKCTFQDVARYEKISFTDFGKPEETFTFEARDTCLIKSQSQKINTNLIRFKLHDLSIDRFKLSASTELLIGNYTETEWKKRIVQSDECIAPSKIKKNAFIEKGCP